MKKRKFTIGLCFLLIFVAVGGIAFAKGKGNYHFKGNCIHAGCHCTEFWAEAGTSKCYYCGHFDYLHKK